MASPLRVRRVTGYLGARSRAASADRSGAHSHAARCILRAPKHPAWLTITNPAASAIGFAVGGSALRRDLEGYRPRFGWPLAHQATATLGRPMVIPSRRHAADSGTATYSWSNPAYAGSGSHFELLYTKSTQSAKSASQGQAWYAAGSAVHPAYHEAPPTSGTHPPHMEGRGAGSSRDGLRGEMSCFRVRQLPAYLTANPVSLVRVALNPPVS